MDQFARMRQLIGSTSEWAANDIVLGFGELGVERVSATEYRIKCGDGVARWSVLPYIIATTSDINAAVQNALDGKLSRSGGTMTGALILAHAAASANEAVTLAQLNNEVAKLNAADATFLRTSGGVMTGHFKLFGDATDPLEATTLQQVQGLINSSGHGARALSELTDVDTIVHAPTDGQALVWVAAANMWRPITIAGGTGGGTAGVHSFNSRTGNVVPLKGDYSAFFKDASYVPAWSDVTGKPTTFAPSTHTHTIANVTGLQTALDAKAPLASPALTGAPTAPSAAAYTKSTQLATTEQVYNTVTTEPESRQAGATYKLAMTDAGKMVTLNNATAIALTIPTNAEVAFPINTRIDLLQFGAGQVSVGGTGITIHSSGGKKMLSGQYAGATLWKHGADDWVLIGDIA